MKVLRDYIIPQGFKVIKAQGANRNRNYVKCTHVMTKNGREYPCVFQKRLDSLPKHTDLTPHLIHKCSNSDLRTYFATTTIQKIEKPGDILISSLTAFAGKYNLSLEAAVSNALLKIMEQSFIIGQQNPDATPEEIFPALSRRKFTRHFIQAGKSAFDEIIGKYQEFKYAAISIDAGKVGFKNYLDIVLCNALSNLKPIIYKAYQNFRGDTSQYVSKIKTVISEIEANNIEVIGIVADNLRVQTSAIDKVIESRPKLFHFSCGPHSVHNALKDFFSNDDLAKHIKIIEAFTIIMNKKDILSKIKLSTPKRCLTRWTNLFDICFFVMDHISQFVEFFQNESILELSSLQNAENLETILTMLQLTAPLISLLLYYPKQLSLRLESDKTSCGFLFGYETSVYIQLMAVGNTFPDLKEYTSLLADSLQKRLSNSPNGILSKLAFLLTKEGRAVYIETEVIPNIQEQEASEAQEKKHKVFASTFPFFEEADVEIFTNLYSYYTDPPQFELLKQKIQEYKTYESAQEEEEECDQEWKEKQERFTELERLRLSKQILDDEYNTAIHNEGLEEFLCCESEHEEDEEFFASFEEESESESEMTTDPFEDLLEQQATEEMSAVYQTEEFTPLLNETPFDFHDIVTLLQEKSMYYDLDNEAVVSAFFSWISFPSSLSEAIKADLSKKDTYQFWNDMLLINEMRDLALFALRLLAIPASEAACERMFWKQRKVLTDQRARTGSQLAFSRIVLMSQ